MAEYTYNDIIIDPTSEEAKNAVGNKVYYGDTPLHCIKYANENSNIFVGELDIIYEYRYNPFHIKGSGDHPCIIVKKEEPYEERAKKWIKENGLKKGDYVKVIRKAKDYEDGWDGRWTKERDDFIGKVIPVSDIGESTGVILSYCCCDWAGYDFPYFVLEKVEPEPEYVPFESPQEFISAYSKASKEVMPDTESILSNSSMWLKWRDTYVGITYISRHGVNYGAEFLDWDELLDEYTFLNGSPCGKEIKEWVTTS